MLKEALFSSPMVPLALGGLVLFLGAFMATVIRLIRQGNSAYTHASLLPLERTESSTHGK